jgi:hypothetical protein
MIPLNIVKECADMTFHCAAGQVVKACKFVMLCKSSLVKDMHTNFDITTVPLYNASAKQIQLAVDLSHGICDISSLCMEDLVAARKGLDVLDICEYHDQLHSHLFLSHIVHMATLEEMVPYAPWLLHEKKTRLPFCNRAITLAPDWGTFQSIFKDVDMTKDLAHFSMQCFTPYFPPLCVFQFFVKAFEKKPDEFIDIFGTFKRGHFYHPAEMCEAMLLLRKIVPKDSSMYKVLDVVCDGCNEYSCVPFNKIVYGTSLDFCSQARKSCLLNLQKPGVHSFVSRCSDWLKLTCDLQHGTFDMELRLDPPYQHDILVRLAVINADLECAETFRKVRALSSEIPINVSDFPQHDQPASREDLVAAFLRKRPKYIRVDIFMDELPIPCL